MISRRSLETVTALLTGAFGAAVVISSRDNGVGWSAAGVDAGTFPFIVGLIILGGSIFNLATGWPRNDYPVLRASELKRVGRLFIPAAIFVGIIPLTGMVVASAGYVFAALISHKKSAPVFAAVAAIGTAAALYLVFELAFQVSLPRGVLGTALGF
ncbi:MAG TPA: tripartite tricarboxylate transporter TctB family protein [Bradyrhizobium sp.]|nr:tripartite tricarboxylate transporter TctB family protein [Bradyrhizobium sp.]